MVIGHLGREQRRYETAAIQEIVREQRVADLSKEDLVIEGGDVILLKNKTIAVGIGQRTNLAGYQRLQELFPDWHCIPVAHPDLHLDVLFTVLGSDMVLADIGQLPDDFLKLVSSMGYKIVEANPSEQQTLGCNVFAVDNHKVIAAAENIHTNQSMRESGVEVIEVSLANIIKKGGGPRCMTCPTSRNT